MPHPRSGQRSITSGDRDAALVRVSRTRRWLLAGAAGLTAGLAALASALVPGRSLASKNHAAATGQTTSKTPDRATEPPLPPPAGGTQLGLRAPDQAPQGATQPDAGSQSDPGAQSDPGSQSDPGAQSDPGSSSDPGSQPAPTQQAAPQPQPPQPSVSSSQSGGSDSSGSATSGGS
jgi:hypothetical protein